MSDDEIIMSAKEIELSPERLRAMAMRALIDELKALDTHRIAREFSYKQTLNYTGQSALREMLCDEVRQAVHIAVAALRAERAVRRKS